MNNEKQYIEKFMKELTPAYRQQLADAFREMRDPSSEAQPMLRQMSFGGTVRFDYDRKQVELNGDFSRDDLMRMVLVLK